MSTITKVHQTDTRTTTSDVVTPGSKTDMALFLIRVAAGIAFLFHGSQILFGVFGGPGLNGFSASTHLPMLVATLVGIAEFGGGIAMLTGLFTRIGALGIVVVMIGAIILVHLPKGFSVTNGGYEYPLIQLLIALAVLIAGAGHYSLGRKIGGVVAKL